MIPLRPLGMLFCASLLLGCTPPRESPSTPEKPAPTQSTAEPPATPSAAPATPQDRQPRRAESAAPNETQPRAEQPPSDAAQRGATTAQNRLEAARNAAGRRDHQRAYLLGQEALEHARQFPNDPACQGIAAEALELLEASGEQLNPRAGLPANPSRTIIVK